MRKRFLIPLVLLLLLTLTAVAILTTGTGLRLVARTALPLVPGQIEFDSLEGSLAGSIRLSGLRWRLDGNELDIEQLELDWQPIPILARHLRVDGLHAVGVTWRGAAVAPDDDKDETPFVFSVPRLPLSISLGDLLVERIVFEQGDTSVPIDRVRLDAEIDDDGYRIGSVSVTAPAVEGRGALSLGSAAPYAVDVTLDWQYTDAQLPAPLTGTLSATGSLESLELQAGAGGPIELELRGEARELTEDASFDGELHVARFDPGLFSGEAGLATIGGRLDIRLAADGIGLSGRLTAPELLPDALLIDLVGRLTDGRIEVETLSLALQDHAVEIDGSGAVAVDLSQFDFALRWSGLAWPLAEPAVSSPGGSVTLSGSLADWTLELEGQAETTVMPTASIALRGNGSRYRFDATTASATFAEGIVRGSGFLSWEEAPAFRLELNARNVDPGLWHETLSGRIDFDAAVNGSLPPAGARISADVRQLDGMLNGQRLGGAGGVDIAGQTVLLRKLDLRAGDARVRASGSVADTLDLQWDVVVPDLAIFLPEASGQVRSRGTAGGPRSRPAIELTFALDRLVLAGMAVATANGRFDIGTAPDSEVDVELTASDLSYGGLRIERANAASSGTVGSHRLDLEMSGAGVEVDAALRGGLDAAVWRGALEALSIDSAETGSWQLQETTPFEAGADSLVLAPLCLVQDDARLCARGNVAAAAPWRINVKLDALPVVAFRPVLPPGLVYEGSLSGSAEVSSATPGWIGTADINLSGGRVLRRDSDGDEVLVGAESGQLSARFDPDGIATRIGLDLRGAGLLEAELNVPFAPRGAIDGTVDLRVEHLGLVTVFLPQVSRVQGTVDARLAISGTVKNPDLSGRIGLQATEMLFPDLGITLRDTDLTIGTAGNRLDFRARGTSGDGQLALDGELRWQEGEPSGEITLTGDAFRAIDLPQLRLDASPQLVLTVAGREIDLSGTLNVPSARITPIDIGTGVGVSSDQVIVGAQKPADESRWRIGGRIELGTGDDVSIAGYGLEGRLTGTVLVIETPGQPTTGRGSLAIVDGQYRAYGQKLDIETGRLEFTGGQIDNPGLNLTASRSVQDVVVGVQVRGALRQPTLNLYSVPPLSDSQALSYLVTGRSLQELSQADQTAVSDAATRLALRGGSVLASSVGRSLGLDSVEFAGDGDTANTALVIGKQLSPRLFVSYGIGLFESLNTLRLRYHINSRLTLETQSGQVSSADLLYSFER